MFSKLLPNEEWDDSTDVTDTHRPCSSDHSSATGGAVSLPTAGVFCFDDVGVGARFSAGVLLGAGDVTRVLWGVAVLCDDVTGRVGVFLVPEVGVVRRLRAVSFASWIELAANGDAFTEEPEMGVRFRPKSRMLIRPALKRANVDPRVAC